MLAGQLMKMSKVLCIAWNYCAGLFITELYIWLNSPLSEKQHIWHAVQKMNTNRLIHWHIHTRCFPNLRFSHNLTVNQTEALCNGSITDRLHGIGGFCSDQTSYYGKQSKHHTSRDRAYRHAVTKSITTKGTSKREQVQPSHSGT